MTQIPEVRIRFGRLLYEGLSRDLAEFYDIKFPRPEGKRELPSLDWCNDRVEKYIIEWGRYSDLILQVMQDMYQIHFYQKVIDVYVAPFIKPQSTPLLMGTRPSPAEFVDDLTHELFHVLFADNAEQSAVSDHLQNKYPDYSPKVRIHILVHASLKYLYLDVLHQPARLEKDIARCSQNPPYKAAWDVVEAGTYKDIIEKGRAGLA